ncbi:hypothetical protein [Reichenbachiella versicolor]|uniref:hypothetical protein n=1 Tax=Reichenbachiella versicolor TaxID=1821036 RepID=UPI000D6EA94F|nr:hypothetical protein [Reichenbachiella versicolor]
MSNLRTVTVQMTNQTTAGHPATMSITNASATQGEITTPQGDFPMNVGTNGGQESVEGAATSSRQGIIGKVNYVVQEIPGCSVKFNNSMSERSASFQIGNGGPSYKLNDNGSTTDIWEGFTWAFETQITDLSYVINVSVARVGD